MQAKRVGVDDMVLLPKATDKDIRENLKKRHAKDIIYTYIGEVLISVNPFKRIPIYGPDQIKLYQGKLSYENPPHIFALAENAYARLKNDQENQCIIVSGESGAGKTEASKQIMQYIAAVSGSGHSEEGVSHVKRCILESNPLLEAFGNAKTLRNNNSSRFGKYMEIQFDREGAPRGGRIRNFLLEKSRVCEQSRGERNFHIFYQLCAGLSDQERQELMIYAPEDFNYLNRSGCTTVDGINDEEEFNGTKVAMNTLDIDTNTQQMVFRLLAAILWLGNVEFSQKGNETKATDPDTLSIVARLLSVTPESLEKSLTIRTMHVGRETMDVNQPVNKCREARDALAKVLYDRLFDWVIQQVNRAIDAHEKDGLLIGVLDVYGFEIFEQNSFEQFCINYVNEKLQQLFIELTLKGEQEEYEREGIKWVPIKYFDNKEICTLIEGLNPPGLMALCDDACKRAHNVPPNQCDENYVSALGSTLRSKYLLPRTDGFTIEHYAGKVDYCIYGFTTKNKDLLLNELIACVQGSEVELFRSLFPEDLKGMERKKPTSASFKIRQQAKSLMDSLLQCAPHYIRCIKSNENKQPREFDNDRVGHQIQYLGLEENIRVRRAGYAFRREFEVFHHKFKILSQKTFPNPFSGSDKDACSAILEDLQIDTQEWQLGRSKIFLKHPETLFDLEERKERKYHQCASLIQRTYRTYKLRKYYIELRENAANLYEEKKQRRRVSINRAFIGDYVSYLNNAQLVEAMSQYTSTEGGVLFADHAVRPIRKLFSTKTIPLFVMITPKAFYILERKKVGKRFEMSVASRLQFDEIKSISMSQLADNYICIHTKDDKQPDAFFTCDNKTELLTILNDQYKLIKNSDIPRTFENKFTFKDAKKTKTVTYIENDKIKEDEHITGSKTQWKVEAPPGLPVDSKPHIFKRSVSSTSSAKQPSQDRRPSVRGMQSGLISNEDMAERNRRMSIKPTFQPPQQAPTPQETKPSKKVRVIYNYEAQDSDELTITEGEIIEVISQGTGEGWWAGSKTDGSNQIGLFPSNYVEPL